MTNRLDLKQLEALRAIAETKSFHAAAARLHVTQSAISHQIKNLEMELGVSLVIRGRPKPYLSDAGEQVLKVGSRILSEVAHLRERFSRSRRPAAGSFHVAASTLGIVYLYGELLEDFITQYPAVELTVTAAQTPLEGIKQVRARAVDAAFAALPFDMRNLEIIKLGIADHVCIVKPSHPLGRLRRIAVDDIRRHPFVRYQLGAGSRHISDELFLKSGKYPPIFMESNDTEFIKRIVGLGIAAAIVPSFTVLSEVSERRLTILPLRSFQTDQEFCLAHRKDGVTSNLEVFRDFVMGRKYRRLAVTSS